MEDGSAADVIVVSRLPAGGTGGFWDGMAGVPCRAVPAAAGPGWGVLYALVDSDSLRW